MIVNLPLESICTDRGTQMRLTTSEEIIEEYCGDLDSLPPITVFKVGDEYILVDGFHRRDAFERSGRDTIPCVIIVGSLEEAIEYACCANGAHGLRRTDDDKRNAVETFFTILGNDALSNSEVARRLKVSVPFVQKVRDSNGIKASPFAHHGVGAEKRRLNDSISTEESDLHEQTSRLNDLIPLMTKNGGDMINIDLPKNDVHDFAVILLREFEFEYVKSCVKYLYEKYNL